MHARTVSYEFTDEARIIAVTLGVWTSALNVRQSVVVRGTVMDDASSRGSVRGRICRQETMPAGHIAAPATGEARVITTRLATHAINAVNAP